MHEQLKWKDHHAVPGNWEAQTRMGVIYRVGDRGDGKAAAASYEWNAGLKGRPRNSPKYVHLGNDFPSNAAAKRFCERHYQQWLAANIKRNSKSAE